MTSDASRTATATHDGSAVPARTATLLGFGAVLLWGTLASLTALKSATVPAFQTTAITFAIGGATIAIIALVTGRARAMRPTLASFALGLYGLFGFHVLYFAALRLAPTAEAGLIASLWALLTVLLSGVLPGVRLHVRHVAGALMGFAAAAILVWDKIGNTDLAAGYPNAALGFVFGAVQLAVDPGAEK